MVTTAMITASTSRAAPAYISLTAFRTEFADHGVRIAKQLVAFIEVKRITTKLGAKHLRQVEMYAVNEGVQWMILTNGQVWQAWHLTAGLPVVLDLALEVDLLGEGGPTQKAETLFYLSKEAFKRHLIDELWKVKAATSPESLAAVVTSETVIEQIRKELRRQTGHSSLGSQPGSHPGERLPAPGGRVRTRGLAIMPGGELVRTTLNAITGNYGSDASGGALRLQDEHQEDRGKSAAGAEVGLIIP